MVRRIVLAFLLCLLPVSPARASALVLTVQGAIGPASADYVVRGLEQAARDKAAVVVLRLDTPGGLDTSMRAIIKSILASPVPVAAFVHPQGARAASAGTYILYASHVAAMAPATNLGAATPVEIGIGGPAPAPEGGGPGRPEPAKKTKQADAGDKPDEPVSSPLTLRRKQVHDAAAYIRGLAELRGRNAEWAEKAVYESVSLSASQALELKVIDLVADDVPGLLAGIDGRKVKTAGSETTLATRGAAVAEVEADWRNRLLAVISEPGIAYVLMLLGIYGLIFEFSNPGFGIPGVAGAICLLVALFALQMLPVSYAGLGLILLGIAFMVAEAFLPSFGVLGLGGVIAFVIGSVMLIDTELPGYGLPWSLIVPVAAASALFSFLVAGMALRARRRPVATGREEMLGAPGVMLEPGWARVHGETWRVRCDRTLAAGTRVRVTGLDGLVLDVTPIEEEGERS